MKTAELYYNIDELKYAYSVGSPKILTVHKVLFEDELEDSTRKRKAEVKRKKKKCKSHRKNNTYTKNWRRIKKRKGKIPRRK